MTGEERRQALIAELKAEYKTRLGVNLVNFIHTKPKLRIGLVDDACIMDLENDLRLMRSGGYDSYLIKSAQPEAPTPGNPQKFEVLIWPERPGVDRVEYGVYLTLEDGTRRGMENCSTKRGWSASLAHTLQKVRDGDGGIFE